MALESVTEDYEEGCETLLSHINSKWAHILITLINIPPEKWINSTRSKLDCLTYQFGIYILDFCMVYLVHWINLILT